ncbi:unnamed protein product [Linum trigynum]|uniref:Uncharacterized protein n=1 Tax=Linum trigynum TaxID=586398 RepID=A0AAV2FTP6_9ROSI
MFCEQGVALQDLGREDAGSGDKGKMWDQGDAAQTITARWRGRWQSAEDGGGVPRWEGVVFLKESFVLYFCWLLAHLTEGKVESPNKG